MTDEFTTAKFFSTREDEDEYKHETWHEAVREKLDDLFKHDEDALAQIRRIGEVTVFAFSPIKVDPTFAELLAEQGVRNFIENFGDEHGCPEGDDEPLGEAASNALYLALLAAFTEAVRVANVWRCEQVGSHLFTVEELLAEHGGEE